MVDFGWDTVRISELRYPVLLARRDQVPDSDTGITETLANMITVRAKIEDAYPQTYYAAAQTDRPFTHMVWLRFIGWLDTTYVIIRKSFLPDLSWRYDVLRIRRVKELNGRKRFLVLECQQERRERG